MPVLGSSSYGSVLAVHNLARALLNDVAMNWATDSVLLPYTNAAYLDIQQAIAEAGGDEFTEDNVLLVVKAIPANQQDPGTETVINDATPAPNQLPVNLLAPLRIWERPNLSTVNFSPMLDLTNKGGLPSILQRQTLNCWEWRSDGIYFVGATQDVQIRMRYQCSLTPFYGITDPVAIRGSQNCLAYRSAELAGGARGSPLAAQAQALYADALEALIRQNVRANARQGARRRPYGGGRGISRGGYI